MFGVLIGLGLALLRDRLDRRVKNEEDVRSIFPGVPIVAEVPRPGKGAESKTMAVESFHALRSNLDMVRPNGPLHTLLITSAGARDGKSSTAANLALAMEETHRDALVVEADLRRPALSKAFSVNGGRGTAKVLAGTDRLDEAVKEARVTSQLNGDGPLVVMNGRFAMVPAGPVPARPSTLLNEQALESLLSQAHQRQETVIVDGPPIGLFSDMLPVAKKVDGVVVVVRLFHSSVDDLRRFADRMSEAGIRPLGVVLTGARADASRYRDY
jgi:receptor protein-tyrosine kinase